MRWNTCGRQNEQTQGETLDTWFLRFLKPFRDDNNNNNNNNNYNNNNIVPLLLEMDIEYLKKINDDIV